MYYPQQHGCHGTYGDAYDNYNHLGVYQQNNFSQQPPGQRSYGGMSSNQWGWASNHGRRLPLHRTAYQPANYSYQSSSAPPSASNSINDVGNGSINGTHQSNAYTQEDNPEDFTLTFPHVMEQNSEPFEYHMDLSQRPESLQDAISMYIDYLIAENEHKTRISHALPMNVTSSLSDETYYQAVLGKPIPFPTEKFLKWLKMFNLDIEITDLEGNTTPQTLFEPTEAIQDTITDMEPTHVMNWQTSR